MAMTPEEKRIRRNEYQRAWRAANPTYARDHARKRRAEKPERERENQRRWRAANPERAQARVRRWQLANPEKVREASQKWRAENPERLPEMSLSYYHGLRPEDVALMYEAQQGRCYLCGDLLQGDRREWHVDHDHRCDEKKSCQYCRRGLAHKFCNTLIGLAFDDPERLRRIAGNLEAALADVTRRLAHKPAQAELFELHELGEASSHS